MTEQDDRKKLLSFLLGFAERQLSQHGEFHPFSACIKDDGVPTAVGFLDEDESTDSQSQIDSATRALGTMASSGEIRASGICFDVRIRPNGADPTDAVQVLFEHWDGMSVECFWPYSKDRLGELEFGEIFCQDRQPTVFKPRNVVRSGLFGEFFVLSVLAAAGYPRSRGLVRKTRFVESAALDSTLIQLGRAGAIIGATDRATAGQLISEIFPSRDWAVQSAGELFSSLDPQSKVELHPDVPPWVAHAFTTSIGPNETGHAPDFMVDWEEVTSSDMLAMYASTLLEGLIWGTAHRQQALEALRQDLGRKGATLGFLADHSVDLAPVHSLDALVQQIGEIVAAYRSRLGGLATAPEKLTRFINSLSG